MTRLSTYHILRILEHVCHFTRIFLKVGDVSRNSEDIEQGEHDKKRCQRTIDHYPFQRNHFEYPIPVEPLSRKYLLLDTIISQYPGLMPTFLLFETVGQYLDHNLRDDVTRFDIRWKMQELSIDSLLDKISDKKSRTRSDSYYFRRPSSGL